MAGEPGENRFQLSGALLEGRGKFDHRVVLLTNQSPPDGAFENGCEVAVLLRLPFAR